MKFNLSRAFEQTSANAYFTKLKDKKSFVEIKEIVNGTGEQNRYFHLIVSWFAFAYGETFEYVKQKMVKQDLCPDIFKEEIPSKKTGEIVINYRSWSELNKDERRIVIDKFRAYSSKEAGIYLPSPDEQGMLNEIESEIEKNKQWL